MSARLNVALGLVLLLVASAAAAGQQAKKTVKKQLSTAPEPDAPEVQLSLGWLGGRWVQTRAGRRVAAFTAVPYAQPPVGDLRFKAPVPVEPWASPRESPPLQQVPVCMQSEDAAFTQGLLRSEDCLLLNVFTPSAVNGSNLPVLVWLHGGAFQEGGAAPYGPEFLLDRDVVLVTVNYRLGALGFLSTGDTASTGNWGLKDQQLALRWVQQHIAALGGDPEQVTLIGQSAGAISVHSHVSSWSSRGLFQRAVSMGGSALTLGLPQSAALARRYAAKLAVKLGCPEAPSADLVSCLRAKPARDLVAHEAALKEGGLCPIITWGPVVEDFVEVADKGRQSNPPFLERHPVDAVTNGLVVDVPWLTGLNLNEGGLWTAMIQASKQVEAFDAQLDSLAPLCFGFNDTVDPDELPGLMQEIREFYLGTNNITSENLRDLSKLFTDGTMLWGLDEAVRLHAAYSSSPAYLYLLSHRGKRSLTELFGGGDGHGVVHGDELLYLFPLSNILASREEDPDDRKVSELLIDVLINFAKNG
ncbi:hypothetical protein ONE63_010238 [Megalurothrips usitatus]|uniref:Carboxylesterase type B domain-containing protein n=1 Tax=Megalurothrips usitatus TaxID=439358 RepID=A0AAV7XKP4_9NEOP|nr:hypothetical protein ONE63_010238 [Megalurothrips usitatus]